MKIYLGFRTSPRIAQNHGIEFFQQYCFDHIITRTNFKTQINFKKEPYSFNKNF
ncbi:MAG: hypothetical protein RR409_17415 [Clostridium sp.]